MAVATAGCAAAEFWRSELRKGLSERFFCPFLAETDAINSIAARAGICWVSRLICLNFGSFCPSGSTGEGVVSGSGSNSVGAMLGVGGWELFIRGQSFASGLAEGWVFSREGVLVMSVCGTGGAS